MVFAGIKCIEKKGASFWKILTRGAALSAPNGTISLHPSLQSIALFDEISSVHEQKAWCDGVHNQKSLVCWCAPTIFPCFA